MKNSDASNDTKNSNASDDSDDDSCGEQTLHCRICGESVACNCDASFTSAVSHWKMSDVKKKENCLAQMPNEKQAMARHASEKHSHCPPWNVPKVKETLDMESLHWSPLQNALAEACSHAPLVPETMPQHANPKDAIVGLFSKWNGHASGHLQHNWNKCNGKCDDESASKSDRVLAPLVLEMWDRTLQALWQCESHKLDDVSFAEVLQNVQDSCLVLHCIELVLSHGILFPDIHI